ncbi:MAG: Uma2 family endonuclease [Deltaproteobacteria bacterium]|nr:Uma2 family endonuclease [Deltaproteobacteria bacterium]
MPGDPALRRATLDDLLQSIRDGRACEIVDGVLVEKAMADQAHGGAQLELGAAVHGAYNRLPRDGAPGGWWIRTEVDVSFGADVYRPDISGWRRDRVPKMPEAWPVPLAPDWVAEVLSASTASRDLGPKMRAYHAHGVSHYWVVDRQHQLLLVYARGERAYELLATATPGEKRALPPFEEVEIDIGRLFGIES